MTYEQAEAMKAFINTQADWHASKFEQGDSMFRGCGYAVCASHVSGKTVWFHRNITTDQVKAQLDQELAN